MEGKKHCNDLIYSEFVVLQVRLRHITGNRERFRLTWHRCCCETARALAACQGSSSRGSVGGVGGVGGPGQRRGQQQCLLIRAPLNLVAALGPTHSYRD
eukprot:COSAG02_NODE_3843_length_6160_cov_40.615740_6_plen_98_part_01